ncbi:MAG: daptide biosynthesis RiPP recognition protein [Pseudonocardiaceae bacterium]
MNSNEHHSAALAVDAAGRPTRTALDGLVRLTAGNRPITGSAGRVVFVESRTHLDYARCLCEYPDDLVFSPEPFSPEPGDATAAVLTYEGGIKEPGDELLVADELFVYTQDYLATPFLAVAGPTIVRISSVADYEAFLEDADLARTKGVFVEQLLNPAVFLADQCALGTTHPCGYPSLRHLYVSASGEVRTAPGGEVLGTIASGVDDLIAAAQRLSGAGDVCLNVMVPAQALDDARRQRPWLSRYLRAIEVLRGLRSDGRSGYQVSGFGRRLTEGLPGERVEPEEAALLLWNNDEHLICDTRTRRVFRLGVDAARIVELLLVTGSVERTCELSAQLLHIDQDTTRGAIGVITKNFAGTDVRLVDLERSVDRASA